jgi:glycosyltransferase involved in cell wall biosynthesis
MARKSDKSVNGEKNKPSILIIGPSAESGGGVATFVNILLSSPILAKQFTLNHLDTSRTQSDVGLENRLSLINLTYLVRQAFQLIQMGIRLQPRVVHIQATSGLSFWKTTIFILIGKLLGMKTIAHLHGGRFQQFYRESSPLLRGAIRRNLRRADVVIALSDNWKNSLLEEVEHHLRVEVVNNSVDTLFAQALQNGRATLPRTANTILFMGNLGRHKGVYDILQAVPLVLDKHPDVRFVFAGEEDKKGERVKIEQRYHEMGLEKNVHFLGLVTGQTKLALFRQAMLFVLPSYIENLPYALLEAMAMGLPLVTTPVGAIPEIVENGRNGFLIQPGDYVALADRIVKLLDNPELREKMSKENTKIIQNRFLPDAAMRKITDIYRKLISK